MSWNLRAAGTKERVKEIVAAETTIPDPVKAIINANVDGVQNAEGLGVFLDTFGHIGGPSPSNLKIDVTGLKI